MSDEQEKPTEEVETEQVVATGHVQDGKIHVEASLGSASFTLDWDANEDQYVDTLVASVYKITEVVLIRLQEEEDADNG
jgi:hypothetical protein